MAKKNPIESILGITSMRASELLATLTPREKQIAEMMATGAKSGDIAKQLGISPKTVDIHRAHLKWKLGSKSVVDIARVVFADRFGEFLK